MDGRPGRRGTRPERAAVAPLACSDGLFCSDCAIEGLSNFPWGLRFPLLRPMELETVMAVYFLADRGATVRTSMPVVFDTRNMECGLRGNDGR
jgi:hypothetical protein